MEPWVTLLEVHKLVYFAQVAGEPLRLRFAKGPYGPYAENLRHVLSRIDGHLVSGYADGGDRPDKRLELVPRAIKDAGDFLVKHEESRVRLSRVGRLVEGFESPFGMELLASVHWVAVGDSQDAEAVVTGVHAWGDRKRRFTREQIGVTLNRLKDQGWLAVDPG